MSYFSLVSKIYSINSKSESSISVHRCLESHEELEEEDDKVFLDQSSKSGSK